MSDGFVVDVDQLHRHAKTTNDIGGKTDEAADAGNQVADMDNAYGLLCRPIASLLKGPQDECAKAIGAAAYALHDTSRRLDESADTYREVNDRIADLLKKMLDKLDSAAKAPSLRGAGGS